MRVSELTGAKLDYWVALAEGFDPADGKLEINEYGQCCVGDFADCPFHPSDYWMHGGPIIDRECITLVCWEIGKWSAYIGEQRSYLDVKPDWDDDGRGPTSLIAAMRAYVASKFGEEVAGL